MSERTQKMLDEAVANVAAAAENAKLLRPYDLNQFVPVRGDHLAVVLQALKDHDRILTAICERLDITP